MDTDTAAPYNKAVAKKKPRYPFPPNPAVERAAVKVGTQVALAEKVGVSPVTVNQWIKGKRQVPAERCVRIEAATAGEVTRKQLRADWRRFWPEMEEAV